MYALLKLSCALHYAGTGTACSMCMARLQGFACHAAR